MGGRKVTGPAAQAPTTQHHLRKQQTTTTATAKKETVKWDQKGTS